MISYNTIFLQFNMCRL